MQSNNTTTHSALRPYTSSGRIHYDMTQAVAERNILYAALISKLIDEHTGTGDTYEVAKAKATAQVNQLLGWNHDHTSPV